MPQNFEQSTLIGLLLTCEVALNSDEVQFGPPLIRIDILEFQPDLLGCRVLHLREPISKNSKHVDFSLFPIDRHLKKEQTWIDDWNRLVSTERTLAQEVSIQTNSRKVYLLRQKLTYFEG